MNLNGNHFMVDIETLSTRITARIMQVAVVVFNAQGIIDQKMWVLDQARQPSRHVDIGTLLFWLNTNPERLRTLLSPGGAVGVEDFHSDLVAMRDKYSPEGWWAHSPSFDLVLLEDLFKWCKLISPWAFRQALDTRTLSYLADAKMIKADPKDQHDALSDALAQARWVINVVNS